MPQWITCLVVGEIKVILDAVGFPKLVPTDMVDISKVSEKELNKLYLLAPSPTRALERSKTFHGVANAMAQQWGSL